LPLVHPCSYGLAFRVTAGTAMRGLRGPAGRRASRVRGAAWRIGRRRAYG
jgi:hypothetical protein